MREKMANWRGLLSPAFPYPPRRDASGVDGDFRLSTDHLSLSKYTAAVNLHFAVPGVAIERDPPLSVSANSVSLHSYGPVASRTVRLLAVHRMDATVLAIETSIGLFNRESRHFLALGS